MPDEDRPLTRHFTEMETGSLVLCNLLKVGLIRCEAGKQLGCALQSIF